MLPTVNNSKSLADEIVNVNDYFKAANAEQGIIDYINSNVELYITESSVTDTIFTKNKEVSYSYDYYIKLNTTSNIDVRECILEALDKLEINFSSTSKVRVAIELPNIDVNLLNLLWSKLSLVITETSDYQIVQRKI